MTVEDFYEKIEWEGGIADALAYGLHADDLPEDAVEHRKLWRDLEDWYEQGAVLFDAWINASPEWDALGDEE